MNELDHLVELHDYETEAPVYLDLGQVSLMTRLPAFTSDLTHTRCSARTKLLLDMERGGTFGRTDCLLVRETPGEIWAIANKRSAPPMEPSTE